MFTITTCSVLPSYVKDFIGMVYSDTGGYGRTTIDGGFDNLRFCQESFFSSKHPYVIDVSCDSEILGDNRLLVEELFSLPHCSLKFVYSVEREGYLQCQIKHRFHLNKEP